jgi:hypothetical protein
MNGRLKVIIFCHLVIKREMTNINFIFIKFKRMKNRHVWNDVHHFWRWYLFIIHNYLSALHFWFWSGCYVLNSMYNVLCCFNFFSVSINTNEFFDYSESSITITFLMFFCKEILLSVQIRRQTCKCHKIVPDFTLFSVVTSNLQFFDLVWLENWMIQNFKQNFVYKIYIMIQNFRNNIKIKEFSVLIPIYIN